MNQLMQQKTFIEKLSSDQEKVSARAACFPVC